MHAYVYVCVCVSFVKIEHLCYYSASDSELENSARPQETAKTHSTQNRGNKAAICTKLSMKGVCVLIINPRGANMYVLFEKYVVNYK